MIFIAQMADSEKLIFAVLGNRNSFYGLSLFCCLEMYIVCEIIFSFYENYPDITVEITFFD